MSASVNRYIPQLGLVHVKVVDAHFLFLKRLYLVCCSDTLPSYSQSKIQWLVQDFRWQKNHVVKSPWLYQNYIFGNIFKGRWYLKPCEYWQSPAFFLYYITSPRIDPVKQLELLDLISQTYAVTLCWQIKIQINLPCVKKKRAEREWETLNKRCHLTLWILMKWIHRLFPQGKKQIAAAIYQQTWVKCPRREDEASHQHL